MHLYSRFILYMLHSLVFLYDREHSRIFFPLQLKSYSHILGLMLLALKAYHRAAAFKLNERLSEMLTYKLVDDVYRGSSINQEAQVASERARNAKYQVALENAKAETRAAQNALSKAMTKPLDQAINEARIASLTEENRKLKEENSRLRQALQRLTDFVREKAPSWLRDFMAKANELLPMKQRHQGLDR